MVRRAFTLIELLVVMAIVAILLAILLPSLGRARAQAYQVRCATNLRTCGMGVFYYAQDPTNGNGYLPLFGCETEIYPGAYWANQILPYVKVRRTLVGRRDGLLMCPADDDFKYVWVNGKDGRGLHAGRLASEEDKRRVDGDADTAGSIVIEPMSYVGTNDMLVAGQRWAGVDAHETPRKLLELKRPYCQMLLTEASHRLAYCFRWADIAREPFDGSSRVRRNYRRHYGGASLDSNGMNWLFADGHVQWHSARYASGRLICCVDLGDGRYENLEYSLAAQATACERFSVANRPGRGDGRRK